MVMYIMKGRVRLIGIGVYLPPFTAAVKGKQSLKNLYAAMFLALQRVVNYSVSVKRTSRMILR